MRAVLQYITNMQPPQHPEYKTKIASSGASTLIQPVGSGVLSCGGKGGGFCSFKQSDTTALRALRALRRCISVRPPLKVALKNTHGGVERPVITETRLNQRTYTGSY